MNAHSVKILAKESEVWSIDDLIPYARNARKHPPEQVAQLAASMREFGFTMPVLVAEDGTIIAGHGRVLAAQELGMTEVPVIVARGWTDAQRRAYTLADNQLALTSEWDEDLLKIELGDLREEGFDLGLIGFDAKELDKLLGVGTAGLTDPDETPEPEEVAVTRPGDIWILGEHRIICGDSTDAATVEALLAGEKPHLMVTDPPYGVEYEPDWRNKALRADGTPIAGRAVGEVLNDDRADWREAWELFPGDVAYVWCAPGPLQCVVHDSMCAASIEPRQQIVWAKSNFAIGRGHYHYQHEVCWYGVRKGGTSHWNGDRKQTTLWEIPKPAKSETGHGTQKPVECMKRPIENNSQPGDAVYEPFSGSGTTIIAAEMTGRRCFAVELNPAYVDIAVRRWQAFTGQEAVLQADGRSFDEVAAERLRDAA